MQSASNFRYVEKTNRRQRNSRYQRLFCHYSRSGASVNVFLLYAQFSLPVRPSGPRKMEEKPQPPAKRRCRANARRRQKRSNQYAIRPVPFSNGHLGGFLADASSFPTAEPPRPSKEKQWIWIVYGTAYRICSPSRIDRYNSELTRREPGSLRSTGKGARD